MLVNAVRGHLAEFGVIAPQGLRNVGKLIAVIRDEDDARLPGLARQVLQLGKPYADFRPWNNQPGLAANVPQFPDDGACSDKAYQSERLWRAPATKEKAIEITPSE